MTPLFRLNPVFSLCLASTSPRRRQLLASLGLEFTVLAPETAEPTWEPDLSPAEYAALAARAKAENVSTSPGLRQPAIIGADTVVAIDGRVLGKPHDVDDALAMLLALNGRWHEVFTAVIILLPDAEIAFCERTRVLFGAWPESALAAYAQSGEPLDKAGAYGIQERGAFLVEKIEGSWSNVVGLPLARLAQGLLQTGVILPRPAWRQ